MEGLEAMKNRLSHNCLRVLLVIMGLSLAGCAALNKTAPENRIEGTVWYKERMLLPPDAEVAVFLEDVSKADAPATIIASTAFKAKESPPWDFVLTFDPDTIEERNRYGLRAKITRDEQLLFVSTEANPVFRDDGDNSVRIQVSRVDNAFAEGKNSSPSTTDLAGIAWQLVGMGGDANDPEAVKKPLNIVFVEEGKQVHGYAGCNSFTGGYSQAEAQLSFEAIAATSMACGEGMAREREFLEALRDTTQLEIENGELTLLNDDSEPLLRFKSGAAL
jgi:putative lipoprotein